ERHGILERALRRGRGLEDGSARLVENDDEIDDALEGQIGQPGGHASHERGPVTLRDTLHEGRVPGQETRLAAQGRLRVSGEKPGGLLTSRRRVLAREGEVAQGDGNPAHAQPAENQRGQGDYDEQPPCEETHGRIPGRRSPGATSIFVSARYGNFSGGYVSIS